MVKDIDVKKFIKANTKYKIKPLYILWKKIENPNEELGNYIGNRILPSPMYLVASEYLMALIPEDTFNNLIAEAEKKSLNYISESEMPINFLKEHYDFDMQMCEPTSISFEDHPNSETKNKVRTVTFVETETGIYPMDKDMLDCFKADIMYYSRSGRYVWAETTTGFVLALSILLTMTPAKVNQFVKIANCVS